MFRSRRQFEQPNLLKQLKNSCVAILIGLVALGGLFSSAIACPFCSAVNLTFTEQLKSKDVVVVAELLVLPKPSSDPDADLPRAVLKITRVIKGDQFVEAGMKFNVTVVGRYPIGQSFLVMGVNPPDIDWTTPMKASERVFQYLKDIQKLPESGADRLAFFQQFFEDEESVLAFDAYDEFARAPYADLIELKDQMPRDKLLGWIKDPETSVNRRRLYLTMLGVCGDAEDSTTLKSFLESGDRKQQAGLDALIASYLTLSGDAGVDLIENEFLKNPDVDYVDTLAAVSALRFHGTEVEIVSKDRVVAAVRTLLDRPKLADMIIPDLARWQDWSVMERLVKMFKDADEDSNWLRVPVITYLNECPLPKAKAYLAELEKIDPDAVRRAAMFSHGFDDFDDDDDDDEEETETSASEANEAQSGETQATESQPAGVGNDGPATSDDTRHSQPANHAQDTQFVAVFTNQPTTVTQSSAAGNSTPRHTVRRVPTDSANPDSPVSLASAAGSPESNKQDVGSVATIAASGSVENLPPVSDLVISQANDRNANPLPGVDTAPIAAAQPVYNLTLAIIFVPMAISVLIFALLWSVVSGWFERLIF